MNTSHLRRTLLPWLPATTVLHGCGSGQSDHDSASSAAAAAGPESGGLPANARPDQIPSVEPKIGEAPRNLLAPLERTWYQWTGEVQPAVIYDGKYGQVWVEPPAGGGITQAVLRYTTLPSFESGRPHELKLRASSIGAAASLFFFDDQHRLIAVDGIDWVQTFADQPWLDSGGQGGTHFTWPAGVAYFVLQVQGRWNATSRDILWPELVTAG